MDVELHPGDDEAVIRPVVGAADRLGYQHVLTITCPDENMMQHLLASRLGLSALCHLRSCEAEEVVGHEEPRFWASLQTKEADLITTVENTGE
ncbi:unnamed protein product [Schistocephalus solidus]|uniref:Protein-tyrosine-phosphatase n=1 Tax=Schistocephalus solidus TaxID=70667 RepID=A0A183SWT2_SCHSO|nr:unnamed protein product [Schistocephalus solidus]